MSDRVAPAGTGIKSDTGHGPQPATADELNLTLARLAVLHPNKVKPADDEARELVRRQRRSPETRRLVAVLAVQRRNQRRTPIVHVPPGREREPRPRAQSRRRAGSSRDGPSRSSDDEPEPPPVALIRGFTAASERLSRHLQRRAAARYVA
jgi:hypothetical protein